MQVNNNMYKKLNAYIAIFILMFSMVPVNAAPNIYNNEVPADVGLRGLFFTDVDPSNIYVKLLDNGMYNITSTDSMYNVTFRIDQRALDSRFKNYNGRTVGITHYAHDGSLDHYVRELVPNIQGFAYLTVDLSTIIVSGFTGYTTQTYSSLSGNQSISVPNGTSYDLNINNNQGGVSTDGKSYQNKSLITINGSMVTTETGIPLQLFTNLEGVNGSGDIGIAYTNLTAIPREIEYVWGDDNVSLFFPFNTVSGVDGEFVVLWGADNTTEPAADSTYGSEAVWGASHKAVWHMNTDPSVEFLDSTSNDNDGSPTSMVSGDLVNGMYGKEYDFGTTAKYVDVPDSASLDLTTTGELTFVFNPTDDANEILLDKIKYFEGLGSGYAARIISTDELMGYVLDGSGSPWESLITTTNPIVESSDNIMTVKWNTTGFYIFKNGVLVKSDLALQNGAAVTDTDLRIAKSITTGFFGDVNYNGEISEIRLSESHSSNYISTFHRNLFNPTATGTAPFYKSIGAPQTITGTTNITTSITGDSNTQQYNTSQSREFTLTPTGFTDELTINTTSTDYDITITTYWQEDTTRYEQIDADNGYFYEKINYTPSHNVSLGYLTDTISTDIIDFNSTDYIGTATVTGADSVTLIGQEINATVSNLIAGNSYWINITIPYNNIPTVSEIQNQSAYVDVPEYFTKPSFIDPEGYDFSSIFWNFGDGNTSQAHNPVHTYTSPGTYTANCTITEAATVSPHPITVEFTVIVATMTLSSNKTITFIDPALGDPNTKLLFFYENGTSAGVLTTTDHVSVQRYTDLVIHKQNNQIRISDDPRGFMYWIVDRMGYAIIVIVAGMIISIGILGIALQAAKDSANLGYKRKW